MSIKRILVPLPGSPSHTGEIELALSAAKALGAHVQALFITQPPPLTRWRRKRQRTGTNGDRRIGKLAR
jgi:hypothetical protein